MSAYKPSLLYKIYIELRSKQIKVVYEEYLHCAPVPKLDFIIIVASYMNNNHTILNFPVYQCTMCIMDVISVNAHLITIKL